MDKEEVVTLCRNAEKIVLLFTDIAGNTLSMTVPASRARIALDGVYFDGSSVDGFTGIENSDLLLKPDLDSIRIDWSKTAYLICDILNPDLSRFEGCPRGRLKKITKHSQLHNGFIHMFGAEAEFFMLDEDGDPFDYGGYFSSQPEDQCSGLRDNIVSRLDDIGIYVEASHHEVAPGQNEIDFSYSEALRCADNLVLFKHIVKTAGVKVTFMPKPFNDMNGSGMHVHQSITDYEGNNLFSSEDGLSDLAKSYVAGLLDNMEVFTAITNPTVNSYKRLVPGYEAPVNIAWSYRNRSAAIRIPSSSPEGTRCEIRSPDPSSNPYLAFAALICSGLDGISRSLELQDETLGNLFSDNVESSHIEKLPSSLEDAVLCLASSMLMRECLGTHILKEFIRMKTEEQEEYSVEVHDWERERYL